MIAVISSTIAPSSSPSHDGARTNIDVPTRLAQTVGSVQSLSGLGFDAIFLVDNSASPLGADAIAQLAPARVLSFQHFAYRNKGIAEARLLAAACEFLPASQPIMKLSGRYRASLNLTQALGGDDFAGKFAPAGDVSTRGYAVRDREFFHRLLLGALDELYAAPWRVVGPRSLLALIRRVARPDRDSFPYADPPVSLEAATGSWLKRHRAAVRRLDSLGIEGVMGSWINPEVKE